jgi:hypothetical protein
MAVSLLEDIFLPMLLQPDFSFGRVVVRSVLLRLWTLLVGLPPKDPKVFQKQTVPTTSIYI